VANGSTVPLEIGNIKDGEVIDVPFTVVNNTSNSGAADLVIQSIAIAVRIRCRRARSLRVPMPDRAE